MQEEFEPFSWELEVFGKFMPGRLRDPTPGMDVGALALRLRRSVGKCGNLERRPLHQMTAHYDPG